jgi:23S rRNA (uracil1939-C5)-methyltransferase
VIGAARAYHPPMTDTPAPSVPPAPAGAAADRAILRLTVERIGPGGEGLAPAPGGMVTVPFALPGETVTAAVSEDHNGRRGRIVEIVEPSAERVAPVCSHFGVCGGCSTQMWAQTPTLAWKRDLVIAAFQARGIEADVGPVWIAPPASRRRAVFAVRREGGRLQIGFRERLAHTVIELSECAILRPALVAALPALRRLCEPLAVPKKGASLTAIETLTGLDIAITDAEFAPNSRQSLIGMAMASGFARLSINGEILIERVAPTLDFGGVSVAPPPGAFLQAVAEAETALAERVAGSVGRARRVADLFAGVGTFALRLARSAHVHAVEGDKAATAALDRAARFAKGLKPVTVETRDLFRRPLYAPELKGFDAVVFDPPRDGAAAQAKELAKSTVPVVVAVSCNPLTLARDTKALIDGGYTMGPVTPVDQFPFTPHIEAVVTFHRR